MNLYLLTQDRNDDYDTYDSCVVIAKDEEQARTIHPGLGQKHGWWKTKEGEYNRAVNVWARPEDIDVFLLGVATPKSKKGCVCSSFNAG